MIIPSCSKSQSPQALASSCSRFLLFRLNPFLVQLAYFLVLSLFGYWALNISTPKTHSFKPSNLDQLFTSVSSVTVSSMSAVEMEVYSNTQLVILTVLMLAGGEVFTSMLGLKLAKSKFQKQQTPHNQKPKNLTREDQIELGLTCSTLENNQKLATDSEISNLESSSSIELKATRCLGYVVLGYLLVVHICGSSLVSMYVSLIPSARNILKTKGIHIQTFSVFTVVSTFANCGFVPTNENMMVFNKNSGLLLLLIPQILFGNTLYPACLRALIWVLEKITKRVEFGYILNNYEEMGYSHLLSGVHCCFLVATVFGFILLQFVLFCSMEWNSEAMDGLSSYQKLVGSLFEVVNSRHTGESIVDLSTVSSAILVLFVVMMYLPPYTSFLPSKYGKEDSVEGKASQKQGRSILEWLLFSQLSYLAIFIILVCITERDKIKEDPLNFNVLNITIEVISAYGNVGFSTGYSCKRRLKLDNSCRDTYVGFVGRWSNKGKFVLILVMFFGRLKKFNMKGGKAWKLS
ncbi:Cation transporter [Corchorus olitorius]|uniref:Cation transporter n=1 Tax=Corchorus olitorius TaxID=93759 RepID=A0A1R3KPK6_9ROSI|nr:Cation transporter [Corchorus olitorius]